ncbi:MAG: PQQ-binding-like beta-propeller repeat protein [Eubacteriales bacterium]|nr:PQQ-binding-like beta-propeller repeat protein [Eubacteriales bacterium]
MQEVRRASYSEDNAPLPLNDPFERFDRPTSYDDYDSFPPGTRLYTEDDYYEDEPRNRWIFVLMGIVGLAIILIALLYFVVPKDSKGILGTVRKPVAGVVDSILGKEEEKAKIVKFETAEPYGLTGGKNVFTITTDKSVQNVRIRNENGDIIAGTSNVMDESRKLWTYTVVFEDEFEGVVYAGVLDGETWIADAKGIQLNITKPTAEPVVVTQPPVITQAPVITPQPIITEQPPEEKNTQSGETIEQTPAPAVIVIDADATSIPKAQEEDKQSQVSAVVVSTQAPEDTQDTFNENVFSASVMPTAQISIVQVAPDDSGISMPESQLLSTEESSNVEQAEEPVVETTTPYIADTFATQTPVVQVEQAESQEEAAPKAQNTVLSTPAPVMPSFSAAAADSTKPSNKSYKDSVFLGSKLQKNYSRADELNMPAPDKYTTYAGGVFTFRGDNFRRNAAHGEANIQRKQMTVMWEADLGSLRTSSGTLYGVGWTGQPAIIKWSKELREAMNITEEKKAVSPLREVIVPAQDGNVYFFDLNDGVATRKPIDVGFPLKSSAAIDPQGMPVLAFGQGVSKLTNKTGDIGFYVYNLLNQEKLLFINGRKNKNQEQYATNGAFDGTPLFDRSSDTMILGGENGLLYTVKMNTDFDFANADGMKLTVTPDVLYQRSKGKQDNPSLSIESSVAMYGKYIFSADKQGFVRCIDSTTMQTVWLFDAGDNTDATVALDLNQDDSLSLYTGTTVFNRSRKKGEAVIRSLDASSGEENWKFTVEAKYDKSERAGCKASPVIGENILSNYVYFTVNSVKEGGSRLYCLNKNDGSVVWQLPLKEETVSSPVAVYATDGQAYIIQADSSGLLTMVDGLTGQTLSTLKLSGQIDASPAVYDDILVIGTCSKDPKLYGIRLD